jgi:hypothetical protein
MLSRAREGVLLPPEKTTCRQAYRPESAGRGDPLYLALSPYPVPFLSVPDSRPCIDPA